MLRSKMNNLILWCCMLVLCIHVSRVVPVQPFYNGDTMVVEGHRVYSSAIKNLLSDGNISKIHVYVADTFYADDDLQLNGIKELQIFTRIWNNTQLVTFDLSGLHGASQEDAVNGSAGKYGNDGTDGGNFFALANEIVNGDYLTVKSNGGNGANGQDGGTSSDIFVLLNVEDDSYPSGWFSNGGDLHEYYKRYFADRGYDSEISGIDDYTSLYAVFVHDKKAIFDVRLHPQKCCGTTGKGGVGGSGGRRGKLIFKNIGNNSEPTPTFIANDGFAGESGQDGKTCESLALDVRITAELKRVVFIFIPLHYSLSSHFTALNHTISSKCEPVYVISIKPTSVPSVSGEPNGIATKGLLRYKKFLLENMKNASLTQIAQETYKAIDENREINDEVPLRDLVLEGLELERNYSELKKLINVSPLYRRLFRRIKIGKFNGENEDEARAQGLLRKVLQMKLADLRLAKYYDLPLMNLSDTENIINSIKFRNEHVSMITNAIDVELQNNLNQLRFFSNGDYILARYHRAIEQFRLMYFPYAVNYLKDYRLPTSPLAFDDLDHIAAATINNLQKLSGNIEKIKSDGKIWSLNNIDGTYPRYAFYIWKNVDFRVEIRNLFEGKAVKLLADVKQANEQFNAIKFNTIDLLFRSSEQTVNDRLSDVLKSFNVIFKHTGQSLIRCNHNFYELISDPMSIEVSFGKDEHFVPMSRTGNYDMFRYNDPILSPYTLWEIQLVEEDIPTRNITDLIQFRDLDIDAELHGIGKFIEENAPICESKKLTKFYTQIVN